MFLMQNNYHHHQHNPLQTTNNSMTATTFDSFCHSSSHQSSFSDHPNSTSSFHLDNTHAATTTTTAYNSSLQQSHRPLDTFQYHHLPSPPLPGHSKVQLHHQLSNSSSTDTLMGFSGGHSSSATLGGSTDSIPASLINAATSVC